MIHLEESSETGTAREIKFSQQASFKEATPVATDSDQVRCFMGTDSTLKCLKCGVVLSLYSLVCLSFASFFLFFFNKKILF